MQTSCKAGARRLQRVVANDAGAKRRDCNGRDHLPRVCSRIFWRAGLWRTQSPRRGSVRSSTPVREPERAGQRGEFHEPGF